MSRRTLARLMAAVGAAVLGLIVLSGGQAFAAQPPIGGAPILSMPTAMGGSVVLNWTDRSSHEDAFEVFRRTSAGQWQYATELASQNKPGTGGSYSWVDTTPSQFQCYAIWAYDYSASYEPVRSADLCVGGAPDPFDPKLPIAAATLNLPAAVGGSVSLSWSDRSVNEDAFEVWRRGSDGSWQYATEFATRDKFGTGGTYTWTDTTPTASNRCYEIVSYDYSATLTTGFSGDLCVGGVQDRFAPVLSPATFPLETSAGSVTVRWADRSDNETGFVVQKRDLFGRWSEVVSVPTRNMTGSGVDHEQYSWIDADTAISGQCYRIGARNDVNVGYTDENCTVRPDPSRFPQVVGGAAEQWYGVPSINGGVGHLLNTKANAGLRYSPGQSFGVDLDWATAAGNLTIVAQGGPTLMRGQAVALAVDGLWLKYHHQTFGVDLDFSSAPVYEWYLIGSQGDPDERTFAGQSIDSGDAKALWNSSAQAYLVNGHQTWGIDLNWYRVNGSAPPPDQPPPPSPGVKSLVVFNCKGSPNFPAVDPTRPVSFWVRDATAGAPFSGGTHVDSNWTSNNCGPSAYSGQPFTFNPTTTGHVYVVQVVDYTRPGCRDNPTDAGGISCIGGTISIVGDTNGVTAQTYTG